MRIGVSLKINVSQIEKTRLYKGEKGTYLDAIAFIDIDQKDQYGNNGMITQDVSKDEKAAGVKGPILGNARVFFSDEISQPAKQQNTKWEAQTKEYADDDLGDSEIPF